MRINAGSFNWKQFQGQKALVIGVGGGMDIASATLIGNCLRNRSAIQDVHIGGVLNPGRVHYYDGKPEEPINEIRGKVERISLTKNSHEIDTKFIDGQLPGIMAKTGNDFGGFWHFSFRFGSDRLLNEFGTFLSRKQFDLLIGVDVGADMLARGKQDPNIQTPIMDICGLNLFGQVLDIRSSLFVFGIGTDAELTPEGISEIDEELKPFRSDGTFHFTDTEIKDLIRLKGLITAQSGKGWNTIGYFLETLMYSFHGIEDPIERIDKPSTLSEGGSLPTQMVLEPKYFGKFWAIDPLELAKQRSTLSADYENTLEQYIKAKTTCQTWKTELDGLFVWSGDNWTTVERDGICLLLSCFSNRIDGTQRQKLLSRTIERLQNGDCDAALIFANDAKSLPDPSATLKIEFSGPFALISNTAIGHDLTGAITALVKKYSHLI